MSVITTKRQRRLRFGPPALDKFALVPPRLIRVVASITVWLVCPLELFIYHPNRVFRFEMKLFPFFVQSSELVTGGAEQRLQFYFLCLLQQ